MNAVLDQPQPTTPTQGQSPITLSRKKRPDPYVQAAELQSRVRETLKRPDLPASAVAPLLKEWRELEAFKRSIRPKSGPAPKSHKPQSPTAGAHFIEDETPTTESPTT